MVKGKKNKNQEVMKIVPCNGVRFLKEKNR